jgi:hypothetical protein
MRWMRDSSGATRGGARSPNAPRGWKGALGLALAVLSLAACQASFSPRAGGGASPSPSPSITAGDASSRNHVTPGSAPLFVRVTFTSATTFDQATAILQSAGQAPYPWTCDDPRTPTPPSLDEQRAAFNASHYLFISYAQDSSLNQIASDGRVLSIDAAPMFMCP